LTTAFSGVLLLDKPPGPTSHDVVDEVRRAFGIRRVGHAGTLDPFASGLLVVLVGSATRLSEYLLGLEKAYHATLRFGTETTTHDPEGEVVREDSSWETLTVDSVEAALAGLRGRILQQPPRYSAKKIKGTSAHARVRRGEEISLEPVPVSIHELEISSMPLPLCHLNVRCSSGTYVRALARDLGRALGPGAYLTGLRRTAVGPFSVDDATPLADLTGEVDLPRAILPPARALGHLPALEVGGQDAGRVRQGQAVAVNMSGLPENAPLRILLDGRLIAIGSRTGDVVRPKKVFPDG